MSTIARALVLRCAACVWGVFLAAIVVLLGERVEPCWRGLSRARVLFSYGVVEVFLVAVKWHVNGENKPGKCVAPAGRCPFGADTPHYGTKREAQAAAEELIARESAGFGGEAKARSLTCCPGGSGLAVDAAGRWYRDGVLVEDMVEAVNDEGEPVMFTDEDFRGSVVSDAQTDVRIHAGKIDDLVNVGCYSEDMNMSMIGGDASVNRAFGVSVNYVGDNAHVSLMGDYWEPGDESSFPTSSQVEDVRDHAVIDAVGGETRIFGMMGYGNIGVLTDSASVDEMSDRSHIRTVDSGSVDYMMGNASVSNVCSRRRADGSMAHGRIGDMSGESSAGTVRDYGFVGEVRESATVDGVFSHGRVMVARDNARVNLVASGGVVEHVTGDARVGEVWRGGIVDKVDGKGAAVMNVGSGGRVGAVTGGATVVDVGSSDASEACVVESVDSSSKVSLIDCWADVTYECGEVDVSPARAREFVVKRLHDDATGIGSACLERANGDNPYSRSNVRLRVRDADGRVVNVPDVDGVLRELVEVDDDEREMMWESMMGSPDGD